MNFDLSIQNQAHQFLGSLFSKLASNRIQLADHWTIDHLCFRVETLEQYESRKYQFLNIGECLIESEVNGRMISTFKLFKPLQFEKYKVDLIELPAPKKSKIVKEGFEHAEVVCDVPFELIIKQHPHIQFDMTGLNKNYNQELEINFGEMAIKFHHQSLEDVINLELKN